MQASFSTPRAAWLSGALAGLALLAVTGAGPASGQGKVDLQSVDPAAVKKAIESNKGKVVLVNYWATWCGPCVDEFPLIVKLQNQYRDKGLVVIGISFDDPDEKDKVVAFAGQNNVTFPLLMRKSGSLEKFSDGIDKRWSGVLPTTYVIDKSGKRVGKPMVGARSYEQFVAAVEPLLK
jgi:thiol-disulfide isomerase/thioredoxin